MFALNNFILKIYIEHMLAFKKLKGFYIVRTPKIQKKFKLNLSRTLTIPYVLNLNKEKFL